MHPEPLPIHDAHREILRSRFGDSHPEPSPLPHRLAGSLSSGAEVAMEPSAAAASLVRTLDRARAITLACVADFDDADLRRGAEFGLNPAAWILGHLAYSELRLCLHFAFGVPVDVAELGATFGRGAVPPAPETLPGLDALRAMLADAHSRTLAMLEVAESEDLEHPPVNVLPTFPELPCRSDVVLQAALHESQHAGQLFLLRKLLGKPAIANFR